MADGVWKSALNEARTNLGEVVARVKRKKSILQRGFKMAKAVFIGFVSVLLFCGACGDLESDEQECKSTLQDLEPCIGFLEGTGKQPTNGCCTNVKEVRESNSRCLCLLIKDASDPSAGLSLNQTRLIQMPTLCEVTGKLSDCIVHEIWDKCVPLRLGNATQYLLGILKLSPSSPDAKNFEMGGLPSQLSSTGQHCEWFLSWKWQVEGDFVSKINCRKL